MSDNIDSMAYYGEVPWHGLGQQVPKGVTAEQMIQAAGLDWEVELRPARGARKISRKGEFSRYEVVRIPRLNTKENEVLLGVVSRRYHPLQNVEAFGFFDPIVGEGKAYFETAGSLDEGERIWVMAKMPAAMEIIRGDECFKYLHTLRPRLRHREVHDASRGLSKHSDVGDGRWTEGFSCSTQQKHAFPA